VARTPNVADGPSPRPLSISGTSGSCSPLALIPTLGPPTTSEQKVTAWYYLDHRSPATSSGTLSIPTSRRLPCISCRFARGIILCVCVCVCVCVRERERERERESMHVYKNTHTHTHTNITNQCGYIHTQARAHTNTHTLTHSTLTHSTLTHSSTLCNTSTNSVYQCTNFQCVPNVYLTCT